MSVTVSAAAQAEATATAQWYDTRPGRYGAAFNDELLAAIRRIGENPQMYPLAEDGVPDREIREYFIARFKQRVIYLVNGSDALVIAVVHSDRREGSWHGNLPPDPPAEAT